MFSLEEMVAFDMISCGYDCNCPLDIQAYWEQRL